MKTKKKTFYKIALVLIIILLIFTFAFYIYTLDYSKALPLATEKLNSSTIIESNKNNLITFKPQENIKNIGIIFYPGGKVDYKAYIPMLEKIMDEGYTTFLVKMPFNLAVFDQNAAREIIKDNDKIDSWYIGGHSLGGAMASVYASKNEMKINGLILLASYPAADLSKINIPMLSIYGSNDEVIDISELEDKKDIAPKDSTYFIVEGGNHAYFGNYGEQKGDGDAEITVEEQQNQTASKILEFLENH